MQTQTHGFDYDRMWGSCSENEAESFGSFDKRSFIWWRGLVDNLVFPSLWNYRVAHGHHCQELTDLRWCRLQAYRETVGTQFRFASNQEKREEESETPTWFFSMFWMSVGSSNSVELLLLDGRLLWDQIKEFRTYSFCSRLCTALQANLCEFSQPLDSSDYDNNKTRKKAKI